MFNLFCQSFNNIKEIDFEKLDKINPKLYISAKNAKNTIENLTANNFISEKEYPEIIPYLKELEKSITFAQQNYNAKNLPKKLIIYTSELLIKKGFEKNKKNVPRVFMSKNWK